MIDYKTTLNQLANTKNGMNRLSAMIGAKGFNQSQEESFVAFRFMKGAANKSNYIKITLDASDTYIVEFGYVRGMKYTVRSTHQGVYNDMLKELFESETKLYLSL